MNKLLVICGPTATGKTDSGIKLAKKFAGEIVSADSRQVYCGMDVITGKDLPVNSKLNPPAGGQNSKLNIKNKNLWVGFREKEGIPVWLIDIVNPDYRFNVGEYKYFAEKVMENIWMRNKLPILVGGTGLYIKSLTESLADISIPPDFSLRKKLEKLNRERLAVYLKKINISRWNKMNTDDRLNPRRLIRAIEISLANKKSLRPRFNRGSGQAKIKYKKDMLFIGLKTSNKELYRLIDHRVEKRWEKGIDEIKRLFKRGYNYQNSIINTTIGYRELGQYIEKKISIEESLKKWKFAEHGYARRQMIWFNKQQGINWFEISNKDYQG
ncbi:hypothetical protein A2Y99_01350, partial [Candidatus Gottesmanbacteria bacterium RBG_13_37_7]